MMQMRGKISVRGGDNLGLDRAPQEKIDAFCLQHDWLLATRCDQIFCILKRNSNSNLLRKYNLNMP